MKSDLLHILEFNGDSYRFKESLRLKEEAL